LYWLRNETTQNGVLFDRLITEEPTFRNYLARAERRGQSRDYAGSLADQLVAARLAGPAAWVAIDRPVTGGWCYYEIKIKWAYDLGRQADRPRGEYQILLEWADQRKAAGVGVSDLIRGMALYRLERFADAVKELESFTIEQEGRNAEEV